MARKEGFVSYAPGPLPGETTAGLAGALQLELGAVAAALDNIGAGVFLHPRASEPPRIRAMMLVFADGTNWNPGFGEGLYFRNITNTGWVYLGSGSGTVTSISIAAPATGLTQSGSPVVGAGTITLALANDLAALEGLAGTGFAKRTGTDTWTLATLSSSDLSDISETIDDRVAALLVAGTGITLTYNDGANTLTIASSASAGTAGRHAVPITAVSMRPSATGGCASLSSIATSANHPDVNTLNFDAATEEYAQFAFPMPKSWNEGTITAKFVWSHAATTTNFGVVWGLQAVAISDGDSIDAAYGTAQTATDTGGTTNTQYTSGETSAITIAGTPAAEDVVYFRVYRKAADGSDTLAVDARLHSVILYLTTDAENDA